MKKLLAAAITLIGFSSVTNAQSTATATATANIVTPISITKTVDMNFGNIAVTSSSGTVILAPAGGRTKTGGVTLPAVAGTVTAASFTVSGTANYAYNITFPTTPVSLINGSNSMNASDFLSSLGVSGSNGTLSGTGSQVVTMGATLTVSASQAAGTYVSSAFNVTVNYN